MAQHVLFDTGRRRTQLGILKKIEKSEPSQDDTDQPILLVPKILPFPKELELHPLSISIQEFLCVSTPPRDPEKWTNSFSFLIGTHTRFVTTKRIMVIPPLTTSFIFMNFIVIEIHVLPRQNL